ncbi:hypothetical protein C8Q76DRAFT_691056 [Earliella scabrosa]|nr:hypothetical protein C8Q76DRAFT_691056 [Earliella scabrosa]
MAMSFEQQLPWGPPEFCERAAAAWSDHGSSDVRVPRRIRKNSGRTLRGQRSTFSIIRVSETTRQLRGRTSRVGEDRSDREIANLSNAATFAGLVPGRRSAPPISSEHYAGWQGSGLGEGVRMVTSVTFFAAIVQGVRTCNVFNKLAQAQRREGQPKSTKSLADGVPRVLRVVPQNNGSLCCA